MAETANVRNRSADRISVKGWTGDLEDFAKIIRHCRELEASARNNVSALFAATEPSRKADHFKQYAFQGADALEQQWAATGDPDLPRALAGLTLEMSATQKKWDRETSGRPEDVMNELDLEDIVKIRLSLGSYFYSSSTEGYAMEVTFDRKSGVAVRATAPSSLWVETATHTMRSQLVGRRPWYWWLRSMWVPYFASVISTVAIYTQVSGQISKDDRFGVAILIGAAVSLLGVGTWLLITKYLPAFELVRDGRKALGARALGVLGGALLWIGPLVIPMVWH